MDINQIELGHLFVEYQNLMKEIAKKELGWSDANLLDDFIQPPGELEFYWVLNNDVEHFDYGLVEKWSPPYGFMQFVRMKKLNQLGV